MILLGEMRDLETISTALTAAETGHLVFATLHTQDAASTVDRVIDVFPAAQQGQIRTQLAGTLEGVVTQTLLPTADGQGRVAAVEILMPGRRRPEPDPPGEDRAGLLDHADRRHEGHADDGAGARRARPPRRSSPRRSRSPARAARSMLIGLLGRAIGADGQTGAPPPSGGRLTHGSAERDQVQGPAAEARQEGRAPGRGSGGRRGEAPQGEAELLLLARAQAEAAEDDESEDAEEPDAATRSWSASRSAPRSSPRRASSTTALPRSSSSRAQRSSPASSSGASFASRMRSPKR